MGEMDKIIKSLSRVCGECGKERFGEDILIMCECQIRLFSPDDEKMVTVELAKYVSMMETAYAGVIGFSITVNAITAFSDLVEYVPTMSEGAKDIIREMSVIKKSFASFVCANIDYADTDQIEDKQLLKLIYNVRYARPSVLQFIGCRMCRWVDEGKVYREQTPDLICSGHLSAINDAEAGLLAQGVPSPIVGIILDYVYNEHEAIRRSLGKAPSLSRKRKLSYRSLRRSYARDYQ